MGVVDAGNPADARVDAPTPCDPTEPFGAPSALSGINTTSVESAPTLSGDELTIYFYSDREGGLGGTDIYVATRSSLGEAFGNVAPVTAVNTASNEADPAFAADGTTLAFASDRSSVYQLYTTTMVPGSGFAAPVAIGAPLASTTSDDENGSFPLSSDSFWFASTRPGGAGDNDIYTSSWSRGAFGAPSWVGAIASSSDEGAPTLSKDGLTIFFASNRPGGVGQYDIWRATRSVMTDSFGSPQDVTELNTVNFDRPGWLSADNCRLYLSSAPDGGTNIDSFVASRTP